MLDVSKFSHISFDCYGTLIDWESGILGYLGPLLRGQRHEITDDQILNLYSEFEPQAQSGGYRTYREVLASIVRTFAVRFQISVSDADANGLAESIREWQPFPDTVGALQRLQSRYKLAVLSNIDDELFAMTAKKLGVEFDEVVTAQQARSYKPSLQNFELLLERLAIPRSQLLHAAESLYHDVVPAKSLGIATAWVNRRQGKSAAATKLADATPDLEVPTVAALADAMGV